MAGTAHETLEERLLHRTLFFTDAVFAIVLTLLVLDLKPPGGAAGPSLGELIVRLIAFAMSFAIIGVFWAAHMSTTRRLVHFEWSFAILNLVFLLPVCMVPFVTSWGIASGAGWAAYCTVLVAISASNVVLSLMITRDGGRLEAGGLTPRERLRRVSRGAAPGFAFGAGLVALALGHLELSRWCGVLIPPLMWLTRRILREPAALATA